MLPPSPSHYSLEEDRGRDGKVHKHCGDGLLGYGSDEVRVSGVREGRGEVVVRVVHMGKGMCRPFFGGSGNRC